MYFVVLLFVVILMSALHPISQASGLRACLHSTFRTFSMAPTFPHIASIIVYIVSVNYLLFIIVPSSSFSREKTIFMHFLQSSSFNKNLPISRHMPLIRSCDFSRCTLAESRTAKRSMKLLTIVSLGFSLHRTFPITSPICLPYLTMLMS